MIYKEISRALRRFLARIWLRICSLTVGFIPYKLLPGCSVILGWLGFYIAARQRRAALESLRIAYGKQKTNNQIRRIAQKNFYLMAKSALEIFIFLHKRNLFKEKIELLGKEILDSALSYGQGVIALTAHFGNFPLMCAKLAQDGYKVNVVVRPMRDEKAGDFFEKKRSLLGVKSIFSKPAKECVQKCLECLRRNEILVIQMDQNFGAKSGIYVDFFGKKAATPTGPVIFALRTQAKILPMFITHKQDGLHKITIEPEVKLEKGKDYKETLLVNTQKLTKIIESHIQDFPEEWSWVHRRWKSKPHM